MYIPNDRQRGTANGGSGSGAGTTTFSRRSATPGHNPASTSGDRASTPQRRQRVQHENEYREEQEEYDEETQWESDDAGGGANHLKPTSYSTSTNVGVGKPSSRRRRPAGTATTAKPRSTTGRSPRAPRFAQNREREQSITPPPVLLYGHPDHPATKELSTTEESTPTPPSHSEKPLLQIPWSELPHHLITSLKYTFLYTFSILKPAIGFLRYPLILITFLLLLALILNTVSGIFKAAFTPLCHVPGLSMLGACQWVRAPTFQVHTTPDGKYKPVQWADYPALVDLEQKTFDQLMDESVANFGGALTLNLKKTEIAVSDLVELVKLSDLAGKESLAESLKVFVKEAKVTGRGLSALGVNIVAVNEWGLNKVAEAHTRDKARKTIGGRLAAMVPFAPKELTLDEVTRDTFGQAMDMLASQLERLIVEVEANHENLNNLEETLGVIHSIVQRENGTWTTLREDLLAQLWTKLGGNGKRMRSFERHLKMLKEVTVYRKQALAQVVGALQALQEMNDQMEDIRERVSKPDLAQDKIAPEVHMRSIALGLERLKESRIRVKRAGEEEKRKVLGSDWGREDNEAIGIEA
ncbi:hypothetical protein FA15DRAFT_131496 [Coprinopsis marcescibilis]|uniref:Uncharacterized protein n=1 Tax=Coprinopsis marcescibilis TaxID=230819 RepID=A0A5C3L429_COPMA|nr:hypothetical protein FA15DRAFT_131496 [Coprinopsis marcescibilis]